MILKVINRSKAFHQSDIFLIFFLPLSFLYLFLRFVEKWRKSHALKVFWVLYLQVIHKDLYLFRAWRTLIKTMFNFISGTIIYQQKGIQHVFSKRWPWPRFCRNVHYPPIFVFWHHLQGQNKKFHNREALKFHKHSVTCKSRSVMKLLRPCGKKSWEISLSSTLSKSY